MHKISEGLIGNQSSKILHIHIQRPKIKIQQKVHFQNDFLKSSIVSIFKFLSITRINNIIKATSDRVLNTNSICFVTQQKQEFLLRFRGSIIWITSAVNQTSSPPPSSHTNNLMTSTVHNIRGILLKPQKAKPVSNRDGVRDISACIREQKTSSPHLATLNILFSIRSLSKWNEKLLMVAC